MGPGPEEGAADLAGSSPGQLGDKGAGARAIPSAYSRGCRKGRGPCGRVPGARSTSGSHARRRARPHLHRPCEEDARVRRQLLHVEVHGAPDAGPPRGPQSSRQPPPTCCLSRPLRVRVSGLAERGAGPDGGGGVAWEGRGQSARGGAERGREGPGGERRGFGSALMPPAGRRPH